MSPVLSMNLALPLSTSFTTSRDPLAALQPEHRATHAGKQLHILHGCLRDPALIKGQSAHFAFSLKRHHDLDQLIGRRVIGELDMLPDDLFRHPLGKHKFKHIYHQLIASSL